MTPAEFRAARHRLGYSHRQTAAMLRVDPRTVRRWEAGPEDVPGPVGVAIEYHEILVKRRIIDPVPAPRTGRPPQNPTEG